MRLIVILLVAVLSNVFGIQIIEEFLKKTVDYLSDPCDDFYRHVCPLGTNSLLLMEMIKADIKETVSPGIWKDLQITGDFDLTPYNDHLIDEVAYFYNETCRNGGDLNLIFEKYGAPEYDYLTSDPDCNRVTQFLLEVLNQSDTYYKELFTAYRSTLNVYATNIEYISYHLDQNLEDQIEEIKNMVEDTKFIAEQWILDTPWANNHQAVNITFKALEKTVLNNKYAKIMKDSIEKLLSAELFYRDCKQGFENNPKARTLCFVNFIDQHPNFEQLTDEDQFFMNPEIDNAFNAFPQLGFGFPIYYLAKNTENFAAKIAFLGANVGHEVSHTLIKGKDDEVLTYFSDAAVECIQNQYNSTCQEFEEDSCDTHDLQIDENGSDILGFQLTYQLLLDQHGDELQNIYQPLNMTNQQLFFYTNAMSMCSGEPGEIAKKEDGSLDEHATSNIRMNAVVNHPAFKEAFKCSDDSRMMRSATEQCIIYGKGAPQNKRH